MKGQVSSEFLLVLVILLGVLATGIIIFEGQQDILAYQSDLDHATIVAQKLAGAVNAVHHGGNGTRTELSVEGIGDLEVTFQRNYVQVRKNNAVVQEPMVTGRLNATALVGGNYNITNLDGVIMIG
ncbi:Uncharacterised protein [uncultured archaeon]|nr:Uncharacterised protein [uncultured archaeon]